LKQEAFIVSRSQNGAEAGAPAHEPGDAGARRLSSALVLPTLNAEPGFAEWLKVLRGQAWQPDKLLLIDSSSADNTVALARQAGFEVISIRREEFSHGGTRQMALERLDGYELVIFLTQDALPASERSLERLLRWFSDPQVAAVYGRQLPRPGAGVIEAHARLFNYPDATVVRSSADIARLGLKTVFISNSFAAWRRKALLDGGGFPDHTIQNEDSHAAARLILAGWKVVYESEATVYHSHPLSLRQEFQRYFDIGVFHARDPWIRRSFGAAEGEGLRYVKSEMRFLRRANAWAIPSALLRSGLKFIGYRLGSVERLIPTTLKKCLSGNKAYWRSAP